MSGPSGKAIDAAAIAYYASNENNAIADAILAAHDPALGLDRSVCLRDVVERLYAQAKSVGMAGVQGDSYSGAADLITRVFGGEA